MVPLEREEHAMDSTADDDQSALAHIETDLAASDPELDGRFRAAFQQLRPKGPHSGKRRRSWLRRAGASFAGSAGSPHNADELLLDPVGAVVVGCDGAPAGDAALRYAAAEARRRSAPLLVVIAFAEPIDPDNDEFDTPPPVQRARARARAEHALERAVADPPRHQVVAMAGLAGRVLLERFSEAAMIVIGTRHRHLLAPLTTVESTEHVLAARGRVPIVLVPPTWQG
jgi:nucleotide-binding universal stress UspA family protein